MSTELALFYALLLILGNAFFVGAEFGLVSARRSSIELRARNGSRAARITLGAMEHISLMLAGAQLGVTLCSVALGAVGEPAIAHLLTGPFEHFGMPEYLLHPVSLGLALAIMVYFHVVIGEMVPKNLALANPDRAALLLTPPLVLIVRLLRPAVGTLNYLANLCLKLIGVEPRGEVASTFSTDEVAGFVEESRREGLISEDEEHLLSGALRFEERSIKGVLLPLDQVIVATTKATPASIEQLAVDTGYSRFPVKNSQGQFVGYVHLKDALAAEGAKREAVIPVKELRPLSVVKTNQSLHEVLAVMQRSGAHLAQVFNLKGQIVGIVALEDVLEELVGEIRDETKKPKPAGA